MKKKFLLIIALFVFSFSYSQNGPNIVKVNPLGLVFGSFNATFEHALNESSSFEVGANYFNWSNLDLAGYGAEVAYRFYFSKNNEAPEGIFASPFLSVNGLTYTYDGDSEDSSFGFGGGVKAGYQWVWDSGLALDLFFGYGYTKINFDKADYEYSGGLPRLGLSLGYNF